MNQRRRVVVPITLGLGMLAVVVAAGLTPNAGLVSASSNCTYGQCPSSSSSQGFPLWAIATSVAVVIVALLLALLLLRRRRRPGQPPSEWEAPPGGGGAPPRGGPPGGPEAAPMAGAMAAPPVWQEPPPPPTGGEPSTAPTPAHEYLEEPSPAAPAPPPPPPPAPSAPEAPPSPPAAPPAPPEEAEPDIDSLMAELEKISGEILKRGPKKKANQPPSDTEDDESS